MLIRIEGCVLSQSFLLALTLFLFCAWPFSDSGVNWTNSDSLSNQPLEMGGGSRKNDRSSTLNKDQHGESLLEEDAYTGVRLCRISGKLPQKWMNRLAVFDFDPVLDREL